MSVLEYLGIIKSAAYAQILPRQAQLLSCKPVLNVVFGSNTQLRQIFLQWKYIFQLIIDDHKNRTMR